MTSTYLLWRMLELDDLETIVRMDDYTELREAWKAMREPLVCGVTRELYCLATYCTLDSTRTQWTLLQDPTAATGTTGTASSDAEE